MRNKLVRLKGCSREIIWSPLPQSQSFRSLELSEYITNSRLINVAEVVSGQIMFPYWRLTI